MVFATRHSKLRRRDPDGAAFQDLSLPWLAGRPARASSSANGSGDQLWVCHGGIGYVLRRSLVVRLSRGVA
jgi:hypothetical protein